MEQRTWSKFASRVGTAAVAVLLALPLGGMAQQQQQERQDRGQLRSEQAQQDERRAEQQRDERERRERERLLGRDRQQAVLGIAASETEEGVQVLRVYRDSPAEEAGLREGDKLIRIDDRQIDSVGALMQAIQQKEPGDTIRVTVRRDDDERSLQVRLRAQRDVFDRPLRERQLFDRPLTGERFDLQRRFRQPDVDDDLSRFIESLESEIRQLTFEIRELRRMLGERPDDALRRPVREPLRRPLDDDQRFRPQPRQQQLEQDF